MVKGKWRQMLQYIKYLLTARTKYYIHSPFVYELCERVIYDRRQYYAFDSIEALRHNLLTSEKVVEVTDFGSGSKVMSKLREINEIAKHATVSPKVGRLLFRLVNHFNPFNIVELGTSLGISTLYLAAANQKATVYTIEGCPQTAKIAAQNFTTLRANNISQIIGQFEVALPDLLTQIPQLDLVFFDGNHRAKPTLQYFEWCLNKAHDDSVFIFDDIHWSEEMTEAWTQIQQHPKVTLTIDLYRVGLVMFRTEQAKEHFKLYF
jgi:predicted O-methyltransferase YrrM